MSFQAEVINVMIASPSDVPEERQVIREVLYRWNAIHAYERKQVLLPIGWETHSAPDMSGPPQSIINEQVLLNCDLLVGIFWTRIGTATKDYASGAVEEIERHIALKKPTMLYFSEKSIQPSLLSGRQYKHLQKFKDSCRPRGLYEGFTSVQDFKDKFNDDLQIQLNKYYPQNSNFVANIDSEIISDTRNLVAGLSIDERKLLKAASLDAHGVIHHVRVSSGTYVETNQTNFIESQSAREVAKWDAVLDSLHNRGYIKNSGHQGDAFEITAAGFEVADHIDL